MTAPIREGVWMHHANDDEGHTTDGGRVSGIDRFTYIECERYGCSPVVVVDPRISGSSRDVAAWIREAIGSVPPSRTALRSVLGKIADRLEVPRPEEPKPEEPTGPGAVVEDVHGDLWVRTVGNDGALWTHGGRFPQRYRDMDIVRVLSEGVTP